MIHHQTDQITLHHGDCLDVLRELPDASVDAVVTDPPYGIAFMGKAWDQPGEFGSKRASTGLNHRRGHKDAALEAGKYDLSPHAMANFQRWSEAWAAECLRILKPGGHLVAFGGSRTWHRLTSGIEDAGFEIRDSLAWIYGSGFPKSLDVSKAIDKAAGVTFDAAPATGVGFMRPDGRDGYNVTKNRLTRSGEQTSDAATWQGWGTALKPAFEPIAVARKPLAGTVAANVLEHGTGALNIDACRIQFASAADLAESVEKNRHADFGSGPRNNQIYGTDNRDVGNYDGSKGRWPANLVLDESQADELGEAARFFYTPKAGNDERVRLDGIAHPTVKPLDLMRWLVRLVTPPQGLVLEPFAGSGTTVEACLLEGFDCIAIEREADYLPLIVQRLNRRHDPVAAVLAASDDAGLFDLLDQTENGATA